MKDLGTLGRCLCVSLLLVLQLKWSMCFRSSDPEFYKLTARDVQGNEIRMDQFRGKIVLVVNVASECGYTDQHYRQLVELHNKLSSKDFTILAFPCNQFGEQEPKRNSAILRFAKNTYGVTFPMFSKIKVLGEFMHPIYQFLLRETGHSPTWNFNKYLIDREGTVIKYWNHKVPPVDCLKKIQNTMTHAIDRYFDTFSVDEL